MIVIVEAFNYFENFTSCYLNDIMESCIFE